MFLCTSQFSSVGLKGSYVLIPMLVSAACSEAVNVPAVVTVAAAKAAAGKEAASIPEMCPAWGFASNCWASGNAYNQ